MLRGKRRIFDPKPAGRVPPRWVLAGFGKMNRDLGPGRPTRTDRWQLARGASFAEGDLIGSGYAESTASTTGRPLLRLGTQRSTNKRHHRSQPAGMQMCATL